MSEQPALVMKSGSPLSAIFIPSVELVDVHKTETNTRLNFKVPEQWILVHLPKGFVALNGCSLTVGADVDNGELQCSPYTRNAGSYHIWPGHCWQTHKLGPWTANTNDRRHDRKMGLTIKNS